MVVFTTYHFFERCPFKASKKIHVLSDGQEVEKLMGLSLLLVTFEAIKKSGVRGGAARKREEGNQL